MPHYEKAKVTLTCETQMEGRIGCLHAFVTDRVSSHTPWSSRPYTTDNIWI